MVPEHLNQAFGRRDLQLRTDDGRILDVRFSGKRLDPSGGAAHADIAGDRHGPAGLLGKPVNHA